ncbi:dienelactone hydrolase family protein [Nannocystis pusilla]|uniref:dienelactone hydrolase family protein n=1 Tax=Nannocystis pusilla TaxID=889268 RepID=UPI003B7E4306
MAAGQELQARDRIRAGQEFWATLQDYVGRDVIDIGANANKPPVPEPPKNMPLPAPLPVLITLPNGLAARQMVTAVPKDKAAPMVVVFHGRDADSAQVLPLVPPDIAARVFFVRGNIKSETGYRYFDAQLAQPGADAAIADAAKKFIPGLQQLLGQQPTTRVVAVGYSQGGALALRLAALGAVDGAVAVEGMLPTTLLPSWSTQGRVALIHGVKDLAVSLSKAQATYDGFGAASFPAVLQTFDNVGHALTSETTSATSLALQSLLSELAEPDQQGWHWTESCELVIDDLPSMMRGALPEIIDKATEFTGELSDANLGAIVRSVLAKDDLNCVISDLGPLSADHARSLYLFARAVLQALVFRGRLPKAQAEAFLKDSAQSAIKGRPGRQPARLGGVNHATGTVRVPAHRPPHGFHRLRLQVGVERRHRHGDHDHRDGVRRHYGRHVLPAVQHEQRLRSAPLRGV